MMSIANEQQFAMDQLVETNDDSEKKPRITYTRKFLISLSEKDVCKKLPNLPGEFDEALLLDFEDPSPERARISGDFSSHGFRRNDYSSSPPTRGELGTNSRGTHGRWEGRSGGWNDKDSDSQSDRDSEPGRRSGMPSRRSWQAPEHDGLLGKGSFPKPSGFGAGTSAPRPQSNDSHQLSRTNEPYHPPRPYKAPPFTRRDARDSFNDETFGSSDSTSEDRAEEERKRRASFELLRKEHQKAFQERQKSNPDLRKNDFDFTELLGESKDDKGRPSRSDEVNHAPTIPGSSNTSLPSQSNAPRPLVPPGFASTILEKKQGEKPQTETSQYERSPLNSKGINVVNGTSVNNGGKPLGIKIGSSEMLIEGEDVRVSSTDANERAVNISSLLGISTDTVNKDKSFEKLSSISTPTEIQGYPIKSEKATMTLGKKKSLEHSDGPSILDKIFNTAINLNSGDSSNMNKKNVEKVEEIRSPQTINKSSKFAHLFLEEDNKPVEVLPSSEPPRGLLSLLQGADKLQTFDTKANPDLSTDFPFQGHATKRTDQLSSTSTTKSVTAVPPVLTCEDLEQSILSEVGDSYHPPPPPVDQDTSVPSVKMTKQRKTSVDDQASQHLLSLLQRSSDPKSQDTQLLSATERRPPPPSMKTTTPPPSVKSTTAGEADPGKSLTLENLFGSAFMNELQSIGEPVSGRAMVSDAPGVPLRSERSIGELSQRNQIRPDGPPGGVLALPEDGNLLAVGGHANPSKYMSFPGSHNQEPEVAFNISDKLAALNSGPRNERPTMGGQDGLFLHQHPQQYVTNPSSHLNGSGPVFHPFDSQHAHVKPQLDFMGPGSTMSQHHDPPPNHRFPPNMIHRPPFHHTPTSGHPEFDRLPPHMMQKMHMQDNLQHHHLMQGFPGSGPQPHHSPHVNNQMPGLIPELNPSQGFPFAHRQPNYGMPPPGSQVNRGEHPASLQTLLGIQQRMDPAKQIPAVGQAGGPNRQGSVGHELDLGFGYR
ncbi:chorismate synthase [Arabidopsis thaliana]|uniref:Chorismate synthase n=1 Tax=Arabidopsis thaliana TaxID=3702 RepID=Q56YP1_ARATH|nr:chorismate synthase [Arabidopsis thaliana]AEE82006.1 chorismate synthase [Arabidopsis thaliana]BAD93979.1 hypothetical protein [Arabidopsis thaliana]|eukprot:NP_001078342.1 chorismate synthase [Arabidopsis thaliana]